MSKKSNTFAPDLKTNKNQLIKRKEKYYEQT